MASVVAESRPPLKSTTAGLVAFVMFVNPQISQISQIENKNNREIVRFERQNLCKSVSSVDTTNWICGLSRVFPMQEIPERGLERRVFELESGSLEHSR